MQTYFIHSIEIVFVDKATQEIFYIYENTKRSHQVPLKLDKYPFTMMVSICHETVLRYKEFDFLYVNPLVKQIQLTPVIQHPQLPAASLIKRLM